MKKRKQTSRRLKQEVWVTHRYEFYPGQDLAIDLIAGSFLNVDADILYSLISKLVAVPAVSVFNMKKKKIQKIN